MKGHKHNEGDGRNRRRSDYEMRKVNEEETAHPMRGGRAQANAHAKARGGNKDGLAKDCD